MHKIKYLHSDLNIENKRIILRTDFNVPIEKGKILDCTRIDAVIPFLNELMKKKSKVVLISHLGRPSGKIEKKFSLKPVFEYLKKKIKNEVFFSNSNIIDAKEKSSKLETSQILLLENIRFFKGEIENDLEFSEKLSKLGEIFINDAFACSHRKQSSIHNITKFIKEVYGGPLLKKEIEAIDMIIKEKKSPVTCIIGGAKISTKIKVIINLIKNVDNIVVVGAMANNFLLNEGFEVGNSIVESDTQEITGKIYKEGKSFNCKIIIPEDFKVSKTLNGLSKIRDKSSIKSDDIILDIGPKTVAKIKGIIDSSKTVLWNGPAGYFENKNFAEGTNLIAEKISENTKKNLIKSILGGGDTLAAINKSKLKLTFTHLSTAGGAFLEYLEGKDLPGISVLK